MLSYRTSVHETTGYTPCRLFFGREIFLPAHLFRSTPNTPSYGNAQDFIEDIQQQIQITEEAARTKTQHAFEQQERYHNEKVFLEEKLDQGDMVYIFQPRQKKGSSKKLLGSWRGPYIIATPPLETALTYRVQISRNPNNIKICHRNNLYKSKNQTFRPW